MNERRTNEGMNGLTSERAKRRAGACLKGTTVRCLRTANTWTYAKMSLYSSVRVRKAWAYEQTGMIWRLLARAKSTAARTI